MEIGDISNEIVIKASGGDMGAFEEIYRASSVFVYNIALGIIRNRENAQEIAQEVFIRMFDNLKSFKFQSSFKTWVYRVAVNAALNARKKIINEMKHYARHEEYMDTGSYVREDPVKKNIDDKINEDAVNELLNALNRDQQACIVLREMQGLSYEEISVTLKTNINTVRSRIKRAREILMAKHMRVKSLQSKDGAIFGGQAE